MPRRARKQSTTGYYHITNRGVNKADVFKDNQDHRFFIECLALAQRVCDFSILAYCIMTTHYHIVIKCEGAVPTGLFQSIGARFCHYYHAKYRCAGQVFQGRFRSEAIETEEHLLSAIRYVWRNPVAAHMCESPSDYRWSSYALLGMSDTHVDDALLLGFMSADEWRKFALQQAPNRHLEPFPVRMKQGRASRVIRELIGPRDLKRVLLSRGEPARAFMTKCLYEGVSIPQIAVEANIAVSALRQLVGKRERPQVCACSLEALASP